MRVIYILLVLFLSTMIGTCLGEIIQQLLPQHTPFYNFFSTNLSPIWEVKQLDLIIFNLSFSISFKINSFSLLGLIIGSVFSLRKV
ncbi:MAG: DUF4321 domain-containing protein [Candidatus Ratteibacteria bacterium]